MEDPAVQQQMRNLENDVEMLQRDGPDAHWEIIEPVLIRREETVLKDNFSLQQIALETILSTAWLWSPDANMDLRKGFERLPAVLRQNIVDRFNEIYSRTRDLISPHQWKLMELLIWTSPTFEMDLSRWTANVANGCSYMQLLLQFCPQLQRLLVTDNEMFFLGSKISVFDSLSRPADRESLRHGHLWLQPKIPQIFRVKYSIRDFDFLQAATTIWENLEILELFMCLESTCFHLEDFKGLNKLRELNIITWYQRKVFSLARKLVQLILLLPALTKFGCNRLHDSKVTIGEAFLQEFSERVPLAREILVDHLLLGPYFAAPWPRNLRVRHISVRDPINEAVVERICLIATDKMEEITLIDVQPAVAQRLLQSLGANLTRLNIKYMKKEFQRGQQIVHLIDLHQMLAAVPKAEHLKVEIGDHVELLEPNHVQLIGPYFTKMRSFTFFQKSLDYHLDGRPVISRVLIDLYKMFLRHSRNLQSLLISNIHELQEVYSSLLRHHANGVHTRQLRLNVNTLCYEINAMSVATLFVLLSPWLEKIELYDASVFDVDSDHWKKFCELAEAVRLKVDFYTKGTPADIREVSAWKHGDFSEPDIMIVD